MDSKNKSVSFAAISGINFPDGNRDYFMNLMKEITEVHHAKSVIVAGNTIAGKKLEKELKERLSGIKKGKDEKGKLRNVPKEKAEKIKAFVEEMAKSLSEFLPKIKDGDGNIINYHIVIAEKIYDRPIGTSILERVRKIRKDAGWDDIRLFKDPETKMPVRLPGFGEMRVIVPRVRPWFYDNVSGVMQRVINSFASKTSSAERPRLILVGCTGTSVFPPRYRGIPCLSIPAFHKLEEQVSTENMMGCTVVTIKKVAVKKKGEKKDEDRFVISPKTYDLRTLVSRERELSIPKDLSEDHRMVLEALKSSTAGMDSVRFRINEGNKTPWDTKKVEKRLEELKERKLVTYNKLEHRYAMRESLIDEMNITLADFLKDSRKLKLLVTSCEHVGALKTLYYTMLELQPKLALDVDAIILNGDATQGISHNYEYNGECLSTMNGVDKQQLLAAGMRLTILMGVFRLRWEKYWDEYKSGKMSLLELVDKCLVLFVYKYGNHDEPRFSRAKDSVPLMLFDLALRFAMLKNVFFLFEEKHIEGQLFEKGLNFRAVLELVDKKIVRVGESRVATVNGIPVGVKHPYQPRTKSKGARIQQTADFYMEKDKELKEWLGKNFQELPQLSVVTVANFHEAATIFTNVFGRTFFGVMTGAWVHDTLFESNQNKVVDYGPAVATVELKKDGRLLSGEVEYTDYINEKDKKIVFADELSNKAVAQLCLELDEMFDIPWR